MEIGGNRRLVCQKAKRAGAVNAVQPFILTIDGVRPFCYSDYNFE